MARRILEFDWATTPLGSIERWPERLRALVELMLESAEMTSLMWGPDALQLYNDAYAAGIGDRHPAALGRSAFTTWADVRDAFTPLLERVWDGESVKVRNVPLAFTPALPRAAGWFDLAYVPVRNERGEIAGVYATVTETTERVQAIVSVQQSEARQAFLLQLTDSLRSLNNPIEIQGEATRLLCQHLGADRCYYFEEDFAAEQFVILRDYHRPNLVSMAGAYHREEWPRMGDAVITGAPLIIPDTHASPLISDSELPDLDAARMHALVVISLIKQNGFVAALLVSQIEPRAWTESEVSLIEEVADRTWAAVERARAEAALRQSETRFRTLFDSIDQGFCTIEVLFNDAGQPVDYRFLEVNPAFARTTGLDNVIGVCMRELAPDHEERWYRAYGQVTKTQEPVRFEAEAAALGRWYNVYAYPVGEPDDHQVAVLFEDITERRKADAALRDSESRFRTLIQNLPDYAIFLLDANGHIAEWSEGAERITGYSSDEALGQHVAMLYPSESVAAGVPEQELAEATVAGRVERDGWLLRKSGERFWSTEIATAIHDQWGTLIGFSKISRDLSERRRTEGELLASGEHLRAIVEATTDYAIFILDSESLIQDWFAGAESVFGWSADEAVGQPFAMTFTPEDRALGIPEQEFQQARQAGLAPDVRWHQHKNGSRVFIEGATRARHDLDGDFVGALKIGRDATESRLAEQRRIERDEQIQRELRAEIAAATAELRALSHRLLLVQEEERRYLARELHDEIGQMLTGLAFTLSSTAASSNGQLAEAQRIVDELTLQVRQLSMDLRPTALDAYGLLPTLRGHTERYEVQTGIAVDLRAEGLNQRFPAPIEITAYRIVQEALTNVARHAETSDVTVQLLADEQTLTVSVRDSGLGFDPATIYGATGLSGMRERAELLGGTMEIDASPGTGVRITAELPLGSAMPHAAGAIDGTEGRL